VSASETLPQGEGSPHGRWERARRAARLLAVAALAVLGLGALAWGRAVAPADPGGSAIVVAIPPGASLRAVAVDLRARGLVRSARAFEWLARWDGLDKGIRAGEFEISPAWDTRRVLEELVRGAVVTYPVVLPEGLTGAEIAVRLEQAGLTDAEAFRAVVQDPALPAEFGVEGPTLEGYLFPETYRLPHGLSPREIAHTMVEQFLAVWGEIQEDARARHLSMREVATLASIVEKETGSAAERPLIASVFLNRLERGMRLASDPTTIYGIADFDGNLRRAHIEDTTNPYNTYQIAGLPPTPIANAGADSLRAVVRPAETDYLYFVSRNDGTHVFARTYAEHEANVDRYQRRRAHR
jgi:peptidoglycan lytic transglycosylase G